MKIIGSTQKKELNFMIKKDTKNNKLIEVFKVFFKMGLIAFGGPAAHIAMMEEEIVNKRKWFDRQHFLDLIGATNLIPGPNSTEMTMHCGHERAGIAGLFVAGISFIFPAVVITTIFAWFYVEYGEIPQVEAFIYGIKPAVLVIILSAVIKLGKKALKNYELGILGALVLITTFFGINEIIALLSGGIIGAFYFYLKNKPSINVKSILPLIFLQAPISTISAITSSKIFWVFLKVGSILYGSGYVLFAYLDAELVSQAWLSRQELLDAIAVGQFTPGPVLTTATFIGYQLGGFGGAFAATMGIFLPSFLFVLLLNPLIPKMRKSKFLSYFLDSVNVAAVAIMLSVLFVMAKDTVIDWRAIVIVIVSLFLHFKVKKANAMWIVLIGSILGFLLKFIVL